MSPPRQSTDDAVHRDRDRFDRVVDETEPATDRANVEINEVIEELESEIEKLRFLN